MKRKNLLILAIIAVVLVIMAFVQSRKNNSFVSEQIIGKTVLPGFPVNDVNAIEISDSNQTLKILKKNNAWCIPSRFDYPVDFGKVRDLLLKVSELKIGQKATLNAEQLASLKIIMPDAGSTDSGTLVRFQAL